MNLLERIKELTTSTPRRTLASLVIILLLIPLTLWASSQHWELRKRALGPTANVYLEPTPLTLNAVGATGTIKVMLGGVSASAGFQLGLVFDKNIIQVNDVTLLTSPSGSITLIPLKDIRNAEGAVVFGAAVLCNEGVCPNILNSSPAVLATLTISGVGKGTTNLEFDTFYTLYSVTLGADGLPVKINATLTNGRVNVGTVTTPTPTPTPRPPTPAPTTPPGGYPKLDLLKVWFWKQEKELGRGHEGAVILVLKQGGYVVLEKAVKLDGNGEARDVDLPGVTVGTHDALIYKPGYLTKKLANMEIREAGNNLDFTKRETEYFLVGDFNGDQVVNILDFSILIKNYNKQGEE